jgi:hypothetical protein
MTRTGRQVGGPGQLVADPGQPVPPPAEPAPRARPDWPLQKVRTPGLAPSRR